MKNRGAALLFALCTAGSLFGAACGGSSGSGGSGGAGTGDGGPGTTYACDNRTLDSTCADYWSGATRSEADASCDGTVLEGACPSDSAVGSCTVLANNGKALTNTFYGGGPKPWTEASAMASCTTAGGTFKKPG
jgi:hypothetical protein